MSFGKTTLSLVSLSHLRETLELNNSFYYLENKENLYVADTTIIEREMPRRLPEVIVSILRNLHDTHFEVPNGSILPTPTVFMGDRNVIKASLASLKVKEFLRFQ